MFLDLSFFSQVRWHGLVDIVLAEARICLDVDAKLLMEARLGSLLLAPLLLLLLLAHLLIQMCVVVMVRLLYRVLLAQWKAAFAV